MPGLNRPTQTDLDNMSEEVDHVDEIADVAVSPCPAFGELDLVVDAFQDAVAEVGLRRLHFVIAYGVVEFRPGYFAHGFLAYGTKRFGRDGISRPALDCGLVPNRREARPPH